MANDQVSLPSLLISLALIGVAPRYLYFSNPAPGDGSQRARQQASAANSTRMARRREDMVLRIQQMFPQVDRRAVLWDLQRNGGSIQVTSERILAGRLETPPVTFQPPPPPAAAGTANAPSAASSQAKKPEQPTQPDLIMRYHLEDKLDGGASESGSSKKGWSTNKEERQSMLQRRRDEMILAARRKMEAKLAVEKTAGCES